MVTMEYVYVPDEVRRSVHMLSIYMTLNCVLNNIKSNNDIYKSFEASF